MRISVICPSCDKQGTLPEAMRVSGDMPGMSSSIHGRYPTPAPKPSTASHAAVLDDDDDMPYDIQPLRRTSTRSSTSAAQTSSVPATLFVGLGIGAACSVLLAVVILLVLGDSGQETDPSRGTPNNRRGGGFDP